MRHERSATVGVLGLLIVGLFAPSAGAHFRSHADPRDTEGFGTPPDRARIDLERMRVRVENGDVVAKMAVYGRLPGWGEVRLAFDSRGGHRTDRYAHVWWDEASGGWLDRGLYRRGGDRDDEVHARKSDDVIRLRFPRALLNASRHVRWRVTATLESSEGTFVDRGPDSGWYEH